jgi:SAM-dependent methyltransferase
MKVAVIPDDGYRARTGHDTLGRKEKMMRKKLAFLLFTLLIFQSIVFCCQDGREENWKNRQPPDRIMDAIGLKPGMVIGEVGAGRGRFTVHLAKRVGEAGKIYANDIDKTSLEYLRDRCKKNGTTNIEAVLGKVDDPLFPKAALDMVFMILTYHHLEKPVALLKNLIPSLKPGATVVVVDPDPTKDNDRSGHESTSKEKMQKEAEEAGFELLRTETFLAKDNIFILRTKVEKADITRTEAHDPQKKFAAAELKEDLQTLWNMLDEGHAGLDRYTPRDALKSRFDGALKRLTEPMTEFDFYHALLPLVAEIRDGHSRLRLSAAGDAFLSSQPVVFPFGLRFLNNKAYILRNLSSDPSVKEGAELLSINGVPLDEILPKLMALMPSDAGIKTRKLRQLEFPAVFGRLLALEFGRATEYRLRLRPCHTNETSELSVPGIKGEDIIKILGERYPDTARPLPLYELAFKGQTAIITIRGFADDKGSGKVPYPDFLKNAFRELEEKKVHKLIIDLRGNGGGQDDYGKLLFAYVMDKPFLYYKALETKKDRYDLFRFTTVTQTEAEELAHQVKKNARGWFDVLGHPNLGLQLPKNPGFRGKVAILIDGLSFSATGESTSLYHYHHKAVFFGEECGAGYYGNTSGFMPLATLPNTRIQMGIPMILYTMAVEGYPKDRGIIPDVPVTPTIEDLLAGRDPAMDRALDFLEEKELPIKK